MPASAFPRPPTPGPLAALPCVVVALGILLVDPGRAVADRPPEGCPAPCPESTPSADGNDHARWLLPNRAAAQLRARNWRGTPEVAALLARVRHMNVLLVTVDALRARPLADPAVSARRYPHITALRRRSRWFTNAFAPGAGTDLCMGGVLTGKLDPMSGAAFTLPEVLNAGGLVTHAVIPREVVLGTSKTLLTRGLRGHDILVTDPKTPNVPAGVSSPRTTALGLSFMDGWIDRSRSGKSEPFFLWLHYFDIHEHHQLPAKLPEIVAHNGGRAPRNAFQKYNALLKITDQALGRLFAGIKDRGLDESTIVVFAADHGESLEEDPRLPKRHGQVLYNPLVHVPLAIAVPGVDPGDQPEPASLLDVPITLLDLLGLPVPRSMNGGQSLVPNLAGIPPLEDEPRTFVLNESEQFAVIQWPFKMLMRRNGKAAELYDLSEDFSESENLALKLPDLVHALSLAYRAHPAITLDRTPAGRKRFENLARRTRPAAHDLLRIGEQRAPPPAEKP
jgi:hypothetical protein